LDEDLPDRQSLMLPFGAVLVSLLVLYACTKTHGPRSDELRAAELLRIRAGAEILLRQQTIASWQAWGDGPSQPELPAGSDWLTRPRAIDTVRRALGALPSGDARQALYNLHAFLVRESIRRSTSTLNDRICAINERPFTLDGHSMTLASISRRLEREPDPLVRRRVAEAALPLLAELNPVLRRCDLQITRAAHRLGFRDRVRLATAIRGYDVQKTGVLARRLLERSDALYLSALVEMAPTAVGVPYARLRRPDVFWLLASPAFDELFPADRLLAAAHATLTGLGINSEPQPVRFDTRRGSDNRPLAACFPLAVPADVRLSVTLQGGVQSYARLLHELGRALHFAHTRTPSFELQILGDASVSEAYALLLEGLVDDPAWLTDQLDIREPRLTTFVRLAALRRLLVLRLYAAKLLYELERHSNPMADASAIYARHLSRAYGFPMEPADVEYYLVEQEPYMQSADSLRGLILAARLRDVFIHEFGKRWWRDPAAGDKLRDSWSAGQRDVAEVVARQAGMRALDPEPLLRWAASMFFRHPSVNLLPPSNVP
jgi:hypothetical protein